MALQDLTPQLRTRLNRMERAVGWFVLVAAVLLLLGFGYYLRNTAQRKGWFKKRVPYFTMIDRATGLHVGDPVMLMGFEVGRITKVDAMPPDYFDYNIYVEFEIMEPHYGYVWTTGSKTKVESDLLGRRVLEVTKGTGGHAAYEFHAMEEFSLSEAERLPDLDKWSLALDAYDSTGTNIVVSAESPLNKEVIGKLQQKTELTKIPVFNLREARKKPVAVWDGKQRSYVQFVPKPNAGANLYWLPADESVALNERLEQLVNQVETALPNILNITNKINAVLDNSSALASNLNLVALNAQPVVSNFALLSAELRGPGALGEWALGTNSQQNLDAALANANLLLAHTDTNLVALLESFGASLNNLAGITSNLHAQVAANTNILSSISQAVVDADDLVQGLKRHWLLRSAFKTKPAEDQQETKPVLRVTSPRNGGL